MLNMIGALEAPAGYDQVYSGVVDHPPRRITTMTVDEVLAWQRQTVRTSVSSAAGRYQIIRPTLQGLLDKGVVSGDEVFSPSVQDRCGRHLLRQTGYRDGVTDPAVADRIAGVWAALPTQSGDSFYEGIAGNKSLIDRASYMDYMACRIDRPTMISRIKSGRAGVVLGASIEEFLETIEHLLEKSAKSLSDYCIALLLALFTLDIVLRIGRGAGQGEALHYITTPIMTRMFEITFLGFIILNIAALHETIALTALNFGVEMGGAVEFSISGLVRDRIILALSWFEESRDLGGIEGLPFVLVAIGSVICVALQTLAIVANLSRAYLVAVLGLPVLAFGGITQGMGASKNYIFTSLGALCGLIALTFLMTSMLEIARDLRTVALSEVGAFTSLILDIVMVKLLFIVPAQVAKIVEAGQK